MKTDAKIISEENPDKDALDCYTSATSKPPSKNGHKSFAKKTRPNIGQWKAILDQALRTPDDFLVMFDSKGNIMTSADLEKAIKSGFMGKFVFYIPTLKNIATATVTVKKELSSDSLLSHGCEKMKSSTKSGIERDYEFEKKIERIRGYLFKRLSCEFLNQFFHL